MASMSEASRYPESYDKPPRELNEDELAHVIKQLRDAGSENDFGYQPVNFSGSDVRQPIENDSWLEPLPIFPTELTIANEKWEVEYVDELYGGEGGGEALFGKVIYVRYLIKIASRVNYISNGKDNYNITPIATKLKALLHEIWHVMCSELYEEGLNIEQNACIYSIVCSKYIDLESDNDIFSGQVEGLDDIKEGNLMELTDLQYRKLLYLIGHMRSNIQI